MSVCNFFDEFFAVPTNALLYNGLEFFDSKSPNFGKKISNHLQVKGRLWYHNYIVSFVPEIQVLTNPNVKIDENKYEVSGFGYVPHWSLILIPLGSHTQNKTLYLSWHTWLIEYYVI